MEDAIVQRVKEIAFRMYDGNISKFAMAIGMNQATVNNYVIGNRKPSLEFICSILERLNVSAEWLLRGQGSMELSMMDRIAMKLDSGCGNGSIFGNNINGSDVSNGEGYKALADSLQKRCADLEEQNKNLIEIINNLSKK